MHEGGRAVFDGAGEEVGKRKKLVMFEVSCRCLYGAEVEKKKRCGVGVRETSALL